MILPWCEPTQALVRAVMVIVIAPGGDVSGDNVDHERHVDEARLGCDVREVGDPQPVSSRSLELSIDLIERARRPILSGGHIRWVGASDCAARGGRQARRQYPVQCLCVAPVSEESMPWVPGQHSSRLATTG